VTLAYSRGRGITDNRPCQERVGDFAEFVEKLDANRAARKEGAGYVCGPLNHDGRRCAEGAQPRRFLAVDVDRIAPDVHTALRLRFTRFSAVGWPTHSSKPEAPRERIIIELDRDATRDECIAIGRVLMRDLADEFGDAVLIDPSTFRGEQPVFVPPVGVQLARFDGEPIDVEAYVAAAQSLPAEHTAGSGPQSTQEALEAIGRGEALHETIGRLVARWAGAGMDRETIRAAAMGLAERARRERGARVDEFTGDELQRLIDGALRKYAPARDEPSAAAAQGFDAADLLSMPMAEPNYIVRPFVPEGVTLWCGRPKAGKTTALRQLAHAVNTGGKFLGELCASAEVWFLSLEEGARLFRKKLSMMSLPAEQLRGIRIEFAWPQAAEGVKALRERLKARTDSRPVLIIIDSLQRFRLPQTDRGHAFTEDYNAAKLLAELCKEFPGLAIVVLHHTTKAVPDDPVAAISGTYGLTAAADSYAIMLKQGQQYRLHAGGRLWDRDSSDFELRRNGGGWEMIGDWDSTTVQGTTDDQRKFLDALKSGGKTGRAIAEITGQSESAVSHMGKKLEARGLVLRVANGWGLVR
jgi:hypothetical protein